MIHIQRIDLWLGMGMVPGREGRLVLGMVRTLRMGMIEGMVLVQFAVTIFIRAGLGSELWCLGIPGNAVGSASGRHGQVLPLPDDKMITMQGARTVRLQRISPHTGLHVVGFDAVLLRMACRTVIVTSFSISGMADCRLHDPGTTVLKTKRAGRDRTRRLQTR